MKTSMPISSSRSSQSLSCRSGIPGLDRGFILISSPAVHLGRKLPPEVLTDVEGLTIVCCNMEPFIQALGETVDGGIFLFGFQKLVVYLGCGI